MDLKFQCGLKQGQNNTLTLTVALQKLAVFLHFRT